MSSAPTKLTKPYRVVCLAGGKVKKPNRFASRAEANTRANALTEETGKPHAVSMG